MRKIKVRLHDRNGWLKLRWSHQGHRYDFALGLPSSALNRKVAERKASEIELDIATEHFDPSLDKYRSVAQIQTQTASSALSVVNLFEQFMAHKSATVYPQTLIKYEATL
jgi:integrase